MKLLCMADLHGHLPDIDSVHTDVVCIAGDIVPLWAVNDRTSENYYHQAKWLVTEFYPWVEMLDCEKVILTWGNHDWIGMEPDLVPKFHSPKLSILVDDGLTFGGVHFWGTPWQPVFHNWAFNLEENDLRERWARIPLYTDVLIVHGPPQGYGDRVGSRNVGSPSLTARIKRVRPSVVVCGHIHAGRGHYQLTSTNPSDRVVNILNCSLVDNKYQPRHAPVEWQIGE